MDLYGKQYGSNPGYGNDTNVGYSPGRVGPVGPNMSKYDFQMQQYRDMYGYDNRLSFARYPLTFLVLWSPIILIFAYLAVTVAIAMTPGLFAGDVIAGIMLFVLLWGFVGSFLLSVAVFPIVAMMMHRRRGGPLSDLFAWTDKLIPYMDFDYYENPTRQ